MSEDEPGRVRASSIAPFALRLQPDTKAALEEAAKANGRSLNAEIVARLVQSLEKDDQLSRTISEHTTSLTALDTAVDDHDRRLDTIEGRIEDLLLMVTRNAERDFGRGK